MDEQLIITKSDILETTSKHFDYLHSKWSHMFDTEYCQELMHASILDNIQCRTYATTCYANSQSVCLLFPIFPTLLLSIVHPWLFLL